MASFNPNPREQPAYSCLYLYQVLGLWAAGVRRCGTDDEDGKKGERPNLGRHGRRRTHHRTSGKHIHLAIKLLLSKNSSGIPLLDDTDGCTACLGDDNTVSVSLAF
ncbi:hypothetical protein Bbelb_294120 [Branchiostoma belcheri]|nr:hypothetical protein Bbelb_294120 [Branchiostoma belcheri]